jgi:predicted ribosomally synthesized peptide with SipW-like signal peptide
MKREEFNNSKSRMITIGNKGVYVSVLILILILASLTGATYAWFAHQTNAGNTTFVAGTVKLNTPVVSEQSIYIGTSVKHGFVPNSGEASVSKVDLVDHEEIARYYTAPRVDDRIADDDNPGEWVYNEVEPYDWRTSRIAQITAN